MSDRLLSAKELADKLGVSEATVYRHTREWPCVRVGPLVRFDYDAVLEHLEQQQAQDVEATG